MTASASAYHDIYSTMHVCVCDVMRYNHLLHVHWEVTATPNITIFILQCVCIANSIAMPLYVT